LPCAQHAVQHSASYSSLSRLPSGNQWLQRISSSSSSSSSSQTAGRLQLWVRIVQPAADILLSIATP
jgi:hypothetical protein